MPDTAKPKSGLEKRTISLPAEQAAFIDAKVASGGYASASEVVREGLRSLQAQDAVLEHWLREQVVPAYEAYKADAQSAVPINEAYAEVKAAIAFRRAAKKT